MKGYFTISSNKKIEIGHKFYDSHIWDDTEHEVYVKFRIDDTDGYIYILEEPSSPKKRYLFNSIQECLNYSNVNLKEEYRNSILSEIGV